MNTSELDILVDNIDVIAREFLDNPSIESNATITLEQPNASSTVTLSPLGTPIVTTTRVILQIWLKSAKRPNAEKQEGLNKDWEYYQGRLVDPIDYTFPLKSAQPIKIELEGRTGTVKDSFYLPSPAASQYGIDELLGKKIAVWVEYSEGR